MTDSKCIDNETCEPNDDVVLIDSKNINLPVSFQVLQDIYNELTGKTEEIENNYKINYKIKFEDLEQLNIKINQAFEQYNIKSHNCSVSVFFTKDSRETFSSFERFKLFNTSTLSHVERIYLQINFMIILPKTKRVQNYEININLGSKIAINRKINDENMPQSKLFRIFIGNVANISVKYVDYLVARNFIEIIEGWLNCLPATKQSKLLKYISNKSHLFPIFCKNSLFILVSYLIFIKIDIFVDAHSYDLNLFAKIALISTFLLYISLRLGWSFGRYTEDAIDEYQTLSYIQLTRGDKNLIDEFKNKNNKKILKAICGIALTLATGIIASVIANKIS